MKDKFLEWYVKENQKYGGGYVKPRPIIITKCPTCGLKHHTTSKLEWADEK